MYIIYRAQSINILRESMYLCSPSGGQGGVDCFYLAVLEPDDSYTRGSRWLNTTRQVELDLQSHEYTYVAYLYNNGLLVLEVRKVDYYLAWFPIILR